MRKFPLEIGRENVVCLPCDFRDDGNTKGPEHSQKRPGYGTAYQDIHANALYAKALPGQRLFIHIYLKARALASVNFLDDHESRGRIKNRGYLILPYRNGYPHGGSPSSLPD